MKQSTVSEDTEWIAAAFGLSALALSGCASTGASTSAQATAENPMVLTLAHGLSETHTVHIAMMEFAEKLGGDIEAAIRQLARERETKTES